jgi:hypothetical protein
MVQGGRSPEVLAAVYRRRRLAALVVVMVVAFGLLLVGRTLALAVAPAPPGSGPAVVPASAVTEGVVVQPGDTLWDMARRIQPEGDVRPLVDRLADAHGPGPLQPGEVVKVSVDPG